MPSELATVTPTTPGEVMRLAGTEVVSWFEAQGSPAVPPEAAPTQVAAREFPLKRIDIPVRKLVPVTVNGKAGLRAMAELGLRLVRVGGAVTLKVAAADRLPPGFTTTTAIGPGFAIMAAVTGAVNVPEFTKVVASGIPPKKTWDDARGDRLLT